MPLKLRRTLSMEDLQNASDDEMDVLLSPSADDYSPRKCMDDGFTGNNNNTSSSMSSSGAQHQNGGSHQHRERFFPFSLISDDSSSSSSAPPSHNHRPRPRPNHAPIIVPVEMPDTDDFFLTGPQAPILKLEGSSGAVNLAENSRKYSSNGINGSSNAVSMAPSASSTNTTTTTSNGTYHQSNIPRSKSVRFEEPDEEEFNKEKGGFGDRRSSVQSQVNQVTQKMKDNISRLLEREANLDSLADLSDQLHYSGDIYRQSTEHLRRKLWWRQQKTRFVLTAVFIFCTVLLFVPLISRLLR